MLPNFETAQTRATTKDGQAGKLDMLYGGSLYLLKQTTRARPRANHPSDDSYRDSPGSEWLGCHVFEHFGIPVQETLLGTFNGKLAVACLDFTVHDGSDWELVPFRALIDVESDYDSNRRNIEYSTLFGTFENSEELKPLKSAALRRFWETAVVDAAVGNYDRHVGNWGYLRKRAGFGNPITELAPVYDCGSTFVPLMSENAMQGYLDNPGALVGRIRRSPRSNVEQDGHILSYRELFEHPGSSFGREVLASMVNSIRSLDVAAIAKKAGAFSDTQIAFFDTMVRLSVQENLQPAFDRYCRENGIPCSPITPGTSDLAE